MRGCDDEASEVADVPPDVLIRTDLMARYNPIEFVNEVRQEVSKVTWPTVREVWITTVMVGIMVVVASLFFLLADQVLGFFVKTILSLGK